MQFSLKKLLLNNYSLLNAVEIDITEGKIEPLPIAVTKFNYEKNISFSSQ